MEMKKKPLLIIMGACLLVGIIITVVWITTQGMQATCDPVAHTITFQESSQNQTLTVLTYYPTESMEILTWDHVQITTGSGTLPAGTIDEGDMITNCSLHGSLVYIIICPDGHALQLTFGDWDFTE